MHKAGESRLYAFVGSAVNPEPFYFLLITYYLLLPTPYSLQTHHFFELGCLSAAHFNFVATA